MSEQLEHKSDGSTANPSKLVCEKCKQTYTYQTLGSFGCLGYPPDTNQASEDELKQRFATLFYDDNYEFMLTKPDLFDVGAIDAAVELVRTEKLKLLAEVRERVVGEDESDNGYDKIIERMIKDKQRARIKELEAEL